jgi:hypothetical protein
MRALHPCANAHISFFLVRCRQRWSRGKEKKNADETKRAAAAGGGTNNRSRNKGNEKERERESKQKMPQRTAPGGGSCLLRKRARRKKGARVIQKSGANIETGESAQEKICIFYYYR